VRGRRPAPAFAEPSAAARLTSSIVATPSRPVARTRARSTPSLRASARTAGIALTPPTATALSLRTASELCIAPTTVPASSRLPEAPSAWPFAAGVPASLIAPPSSEAMTSSPGPGACLPAPPWVSSAMAGAAW